MMSDFGKGLIAFVVVAVAITVLVIGGWRAHWWFVQNGTDRQYQVNTHSQGYQQAQIDHLRNDVEGYDASDNDAQKQQIKLQFCEVYPNLTQPPADLTSAAARLKCGQP